MDEITTIELTKVLLPTPEAQLRYLQRLDARYYFEFKQATPANFQALLERMEASEAAIRNFSPVAHAEALRARNIAV